MNSSSFSDFPLAQNNNKKVHSRLGEEGVDESQEDIQRNERELYFVDKALSLSLLYALYTRRALMDMYFPATTTGVS